MYAFVNDKFIETEKAVIAINDLSVIRGYAVFEFFRTINLQPLFLDDHLDRFYNSAACMYLKPVPERKELEAIIMELINRNGIPGAGVRIIFTGGYAEDGFTISSPNLLVSQMPLSMPDRERFARGLKIITHYHCREMPKIKSTNYAMGVWLQQALRDAGADDILYHHENGVLEFPRANIFMITYDDILVTPNNGVLYGITRKNVLQIANTMTKTEQRSISLEELKNAREIFLTSTTKRLLPVTEVDGVQIGDGKAGSITTRLYEAFLQMEFQTSPNT